MALPVFKLSEGAAARLRVKFEEFQRERKKLRGLLKDYVAEYRQFDGTAKDRGEYLEGQFSGRAVTMSHLLWDDGEIYWHVQDIAVLMGRHPSSVTRLLTRMEEADEWRPRLLALRRETKSANQNTIYAYRQEIFNLIFDHYEEEYLLRFAKPRRGDPEKAPDLQEVRRFWDYLKAEAQIREERSAYKDAEEWMEEEERIELPDLPSMRWRDIASLIWAKLFTVKTCTLASVVVAVCYAVLRQWPGASAWVFAASALSFALCAGLLRLRKMPPVPVSDAGAVALLVLMLWTAAMFSPERTADPVQEEKELTFDADLEWYSAGKYGAKPEISFRLKPSDYHNLTEVFYRLDYEGEFQSTGFNDYDFPILLFDTGLTEPPSTLEIKCLDAQGKEHGPWIFHFDEAGKKRDAQNSTPLSIRLPSRLEPPKSAGSPLPTRPVLPRC